MKTQTRSIPSQPLAQPGPAGVEELIRELELLRHAILSATAEASPWLAAVHPDQQAAARNLVQYLGLRRIDLRSLQDRLASLGLSSLGRAESHVLANIECVLTALHALAGRAVPQMTASAGGGYVGRARLEQQASALFGVQPHGRQVRIVVTLPSEAADDDGLVRRLLAAGMDVARINAAHDGPEAWQRMATRVRAASQQLGRPCRILMDLPGPKLRTGALPDEPAVLKLKPVRDDYGRVLAPARLGLAAEAAEAPELQDETLPCLLAPARWLNRLQLHDFVRVTDARGRDRKLRVASRDGGHVVLECDHTVYLVEGCQWRHGGHAATLGGLARRPGRVVLRSGDRLELRHPAREPSTVLSVPCTLPEVFAQVRNGERIAFDDGRIGGVVRNATPQALDIEIDHARPQGEVLMADQGINLPQTALLLPVPTERDLLALDTAARVADVVALSFVQRPEDVRALHLALTERHAAGLPLLLKIETRLGFENLPELMLAAMAVPAAGVMVARGDLAVELGWQRLAEVQEEILWAAEAAHMPVVWATQVLEQLAHDGRPSRAEITDAAMSARAEAVMLNKGPHIVAAIEMLDDILRRMQQHQHKKQPLLRALRAWQGAVQ